MHPADTMGWSCRYPAEQPTGTRRIARIEENIGATQLPLSADELAGLNELASRVGVQGNRYNEHHMSLVDK
ncbi:hypothetical protein ACFWBR_17305 [Streptomyces sp. NPDC060006]|uniref:hypothetical protein n=1 Tax=unclassified Streptomyces TaxID=2593676 RepID=UPI003645139A